MKDYDIKIRNGREITFFGTSDDTIVVPSTVKFDTDCKRADIEINEEMAVKIGIPNVAEHIELDVAGARIVIRDLTFDRMEINAKGQITVETENIRGNIDINMAGGKAELIVDGNYRFDKVVKGRNNNIETDIEASPEAPFKVELNGKDSVLKITAK